MNISKYIYYVILVIGCMMSFFTGDLSKIPVTVLLFFVLNTAQKDKWYNPFGLLCITLMSYILFNQEWGGFLFTPLTYTAKNLVPLCLLSLYFGCLFCKKREYNPLRVGDASPNFYVVCFIGLIPTLIQYYMIGNILALDGEELAEARNQDVAFFSQLAYFLPASIIVACKRDNTREIFIALILSGIAALMTVSKTAFAILFLFFIMGMTKYSPSLTRNKTYKLFSKYKYIMVPLLMIALFAYNNNKRNVTDVRDMDYVERSGTETLWGTDNLAQNLYLDYCYFCSPWGNLSYNIQKNHGGKFGANTLSQFAKKAGVEIKPNTKINPTFLNTHSYITDYYLDFGFVGAIIASFILGIFIYFCYQRYGCSDDPMMISFYVLIMYATCMLYFSNHFNIGYILNYFITFGVISLMTRKKGSHNEY